MMASLRLLPQGVARLAARTVGGRDRQWVRQIRQAADRLRPLADRALRETADRVRGQVLDGRPPTSPDVLIEGFALVAEAMRRALGICYYDVQLLGGLALARGAVAEIATGEGKTLVAALPAFLHALSGRGVHVLTSNAYLAERDFRLVSPVFQCLGMSVGAVLPGQSPGEKRQAYACDVTYGPGYEFGFDYLRDQAALRRTEEAVLGDALRARLRGQGSLAGPMIQRGLAAAIIDEVDHVLIDDASSPLVISQATPAPAEDAEAHRRARMLANQLVEGRHYRCDAAVGRIELTERGRETIHHDADAVPWKILLRPWADYVQQALRVARFFRRDVHYVVHDGRIRVVDEATGRVFADRSWREGLHQAIEAREGVKVTAEKQPLARITRQRLFRLYGRLCGMTGTAIESADEFREFYGLTVASIPLFKPCQRSLAPTRFFADSDAKWNAIVQAITRVHASGRPVLVGTRTIAASEQLSQRLRDRAIPHQVLNGKQDADEATVVAQAGQWGAVTIATNMAGRGTDIRLGQGVGARGGLHVIGAEHHGARRIDRQLVGRCARQGDPGSAQFFLAADDDLVATYRPWLAHSVRRACDAQGEARGDFRLAVRKTQQLAERLAHRRRRQLFYADEARDTVMAKFAGQESS